LNAAGASGGTCLAPTAALSLKQCSTCTLDEFGTFSTNASPMTPVATNTTVATSMAPTEATMDDEYDMAVPPMGGGMVVEEMETDEVLAISEDPSSGGESTISDFLKRFRKMI
jgi:hypothetical protein